MGRVLRLHHPGSAFHIFARTQGRQKWFTDDIKSAIADTLLTGAIAAQARPAAFAIMDNHFHIVLFQGTVPLGWVMQPIMRKIAWIVQKRHGVTGHVFENRYRAKLCTDADYLPTAIVYVHRNPVKAGLCRNPEEYDWSSARAYEDAAPDPRISVREGLAAFCDSRAEIADLRDAYRAFLNRKNTNDIDGYWNWLERETRMRSKRNAAITSLPHAMRRPVADLRDVARKIMKDVAPDVDPEHVRSRYGGDDVVRLRHAVVAGLSQRGYLGVDISRYMRISNASVSRIRAQLRSQTVSSIVEEAKRKRESGSE